MRVNNCPVTDKAFLASGLRRPSWIKGWISPRPGFLPNLKLNCTYHVDTCSRGQSRKICRFLLHSTAHRTRCWWHCLSRGLGVELGSFLLDRNHNKSFKTGAVFCRQVSHTHPPTVRTYVCKCTHIHTHASNIERFCMQNLWYIFA